MRTAQVHRKTNETEIQVTLNLDGSGENQIQTGVGFLDHMLSHIALHGMFDLELRAVGDLEVDAHHTIEDCALALGEAFDRALSERLGITRIASAYVPMDGALARVVVDLSGRPYAVFQANWQGATIGQMPVSMIRHFFSSFSTTSRSNIHAHLLYSEDDHHGAEALFKAMGRALDEATRIEPRREDSVPSTKGTLG
jgi:imidazoleglycerol-phosphate dehydratase